MKRTLLKVAEEVVIETPDYFDIKDPRELQAISKPFHELTMSAHVARGPQRVEGALLVCLLPDRVELMAVEDRPELRRDC